MPDFKKARQYAMDRLRNELSPKLKYHCMGHTKNEVVPAADRLSKSENVPAEDRLLLLTAAYFHDLGFIRQRQDHEKVSIELAEKALPDFGYSDQQIEIIRRIIQVTHLPQTPKTLLEKIMADADMDDLGNEHFWKRSRDLRKELANYGTLVTDEEWYTEQLVLMKSHHYFTESEKNLREDTKQQHILEVERLLELAKLKQTMEQ
jgi:uncharacterized protein